jgi:hypothetical protein
MESCSQGILLQARSRCAAHDENGKQVQFAAMTAAGVKGSSSADCEDRTRRRDHQLLQVKPVPKTWERRAGRTGEREKGQKMAHDRVLMRKLARELSPRSDHRERWAFVKRFRGYTALSGWAFDRRPRQPKEGRRLANSWQRFPAAEPLQLGVLSSKVRAATKDANNLTGAPRWVSAWGQKGRRCESVAGPPL